MTGITIPPEALERGTEVVRAWRRAGVKSEDIARATCLAMLGAWPGMIHGKYFAEPSIILPLTEKTDDKA